jgi:hypothetical protein
VWILWKGRSEKLILLSPQSAALIIFPFPFIRFAIQYHHDRSSSDKNHSHAPAAPGYQPQHQDGLLFQMGIFMNCFPDAHAAAQALNIAPVPAAAGEEEPIPGGFPLHARKSIGRLLEQGYRLIICDQVRSAQAKGLVRGR